ncbi:three component ABC system middle component [Neptunomonas marina]|uniref:Uncharacterized protein n=1 Tax=Neptunomonas marina TaxID=1815562 RepID=A0A437Q4V1_9GAMM|nr:three component ABC system middle component [Neptunomonas marina]RVU29547.1 hypothetical protein EOE65_15355 [Neptunomonas marina]
MNLAHDVYAETNPAFCTYAVLNYVKAYLSINDSGPELPTIYLALPIAISGDLAALFEGTNKNTGLLEWLERSPQVQVGLADRINSSVEIVTESVRFSCFVNAIKIGDDARLRLGPQKPKGITLNNLDKDSVNAIRRAERLGFWFAMAGSTRNVFDSMGLTV